MKLTTAPVIAAFLMNAPSYALALDGTEALLGNGAQLGRCEAIVSYTPRFGGAFDIRLSMPNGQVSIMNARSSSFAELDLAEFVDMLQGPCNLTVAPGDLTVVQPTGSFNSTGAFGVRIDIGDQIVTLSVGDPDWPPSTQEILGASIVNTEAQRLSSHISSTQRLVRESRDRFITSRRQIAGDGAGIASRNMVPFDVDGTLSVDTTTMSSRGSFFGQTGNFEGTSRRLVFGDFDVQRDNDTDSTTATLDGRVAWERMVSDDTMLGYFLGANLAYSDINGTYSGTQTSYGVSAGAYIISAIQEDLFFDGFVTVGAGRNDLELADGTVDLSGDYTTRTATIGASLTGVIAREGYEIRPELAVSYGYTDLGTIGLTDRAASVDNEVIVDADYVSIANLTFRPEFLVPLDGLSVAESASLFTFAPRLVCEQVRTSVTTEDCGGGAEFGLSRTSDDGMSNIEFRVLADRVGSSTRSSFAINLEHRF